MFPSVIRNAASSPLGRARLACALCAVVLVEVATVSYAQHRRDRERIEALETRSAALSRTVSEREAERERAEQRTNPLAWRLADAQYAAGSHEAEARRLREENALLRQMNDRLYRQVRAQSERAAPPRAAAPQRADSSGPIWFYGSQ